MIICAMIVVSKAFLAKIIGYISMWYSV